MDSGFDPAKMDNYYVFKLEYYTQVLTKVYDNQEKLKIEISVLKKEDKLSIKVKNRVGDYSIVLNSIWNYKTVDNGRTVEIENGVKIIPEPGAEKIVVWLSGYLF